MNLQKLIHNSQCQVHDFIFIINKELLHPPIFKKIYMSVKLKLIALRGTTNRNS